MVKVTFVRTNSMHEQAIILHLGSFKGDIYVNGEKVKMPKGRFPQIIFAEKTSPRQFDLSVSLYEGDIAICNGYLKEKEPEIWSSLSGGCAMIINQKDMNRFVCNCNDGDNDDDFDDLLFEIEIIKEE